MTFSTSTELSHISLRSNTPSHDSKVCSISYFALFSHNVSLDLSVFLSSSLNDSRCSLSNHGTSTKVEELISKGTVRVQFTPEKTITFSSFIIAKFASILLPSILANAGICQSSA
jgi:hypothetical protein